MTDYKMPAEGLDEIISLFEQPKSEQQQQTEILDAILCQLTAILSELEKIKEAIYMSEYRNSNIK